MNSCIFLLLICGSTFAQYNNDTLASIEYSSKIFRLFCLYWGLFLVVSIIVVAYIAIAGIQLKRSRRYTTINYTPLEVSKSESDHMQQKEYTTKNMTIVSAKSVSSIVFSESTETKSPMKNDPDDHELRARHRDFMRMMKKMQKSDADSSKFIKKPPIFIPSVVTDAHFAKGCTDPDNIILTNVFYDPTQNELYEIGTDIDNIELHPSTRISDFSDIEETHKTSKISNSKLSIAKKTLRDKSNISYSRKLM